MKHFLYILFLVGLSTQSYSQREILNNAQRHFEAGQYHEALKYYNEYPKTEKNKNLLFRRGVANYETNNVDQAIKDLTLSYSLGVENEKVYYYVGKAMHSKNEFKDAITFYKDYLNFESDETARFAVIEDIKRCATGINSQYNEQLAFVENLGSSVNSIYDEIRPIQSPNNHNKYYFSSNRAGATGGLRNSEGFKDEIYGSYNSDMFAVELNDGNWTAVNAFYPLLNGPQNEVLQDFDPSGSVMYFARNNNNSSTILTDTFVADRPEGAYPSILTSPVIPGLGDKDVTIFSSDAIFFSSKRDGGFGGYDIYVAIRKDGEWTAPINLGEEINSPFDDMSPFLSPSGTKLYFSSDRLESIGGFDIFSVEYSIENEAWSTVSNLGSPINSPKNDMSYTLSADGTVGLFSSDRIEGVGGFDIYMAYLKEPITDQFGFSLLPPFIGQEIESTESINSDGSESKTEVTPHTKAKVPVIPVKSREYLNTPLYYGKDENILTPQNIDRLKSLVEILTIYPNTKVMLTCHSMPEGLPEFNLYFSIKRSEKAAQYLIESGIDSERIFIRGLGSNFPVAIPLVNNQVSRLAEKNNRRIDIQISKTEQTSLTVLDDKPIIAAKYKDEKGSFYNKVTKNLSYKVLIKTAKQIYKGTIMKQYDSACIERNVKDELYNYTLGLFETYNDSKIFKDQLIREGVSEAKVLPYVDGLPLTENELSFYLKIYPDLNEYVKYQ